MSAGDLVSGEIKPAAPRELGEVISYAIAAYKKNVPTDKIFTVSPSDANGYMASYIVRAIEYHAGQAELSVRACNRDHAFDDLVKALQRARDDLEDTAVLVKQGLAQRENILRSIEIKVTAACAALRKAGVK